MREARRGLHPGQEGDVHPACIFHVYSADEFDWTVLGLDEVARRFQGNHPHSSLGMNSLPNHTPEPPEPPKQSPLVDFVTWVVLFPAIALIVAKLTGLLP